MTIREFTVDADESAIYLQALDEEGDARDIFVITRVDFALIDEDEAETYVPGTDAEFQFVASLLHLALTSESGAAVRMLARVETDHIMEGGVY